VSDLFGVFAQAIVTIGVLCFGIGVIVRQVGRMLGDR
jgi:hypothetical protein